MVDFYYYEIFIYELEAFNFSYRPISFKDDLTILVSIFHLSSVERKGRESVRLTWREKRGREAFDSDEIGL